MFLSRSFNMHRDPIYYKENLDDLLKSYEPYINIFKSEHFKNITEWDGKDFLTHITISFENVINHLKNITENQNNTFLKVGIIEYSIEYYKKFIEVVKLGIEGKRAKAYKLLSEEILNTTSFSFMTFSEFTNHHFNRAKSDYVYRMRINNDIFNNKFTGKDLFHVPFEKRHLIGNSRFSLTGLPCLYFANNVYCNWEELNRPKIEDCFISKFNLTGHRFIDLSISSSYIDSQIHSLYSKLKSLDNAYESQIKTIEYYISDFLNIWPIIFCCSVRTYYKNSVFKPEYIFPQLLLEWLITDDMGNYYDGIKFLSTKEVLLKDKFNSDKIELINYVIPTRIIKSSGYCDESIGKISFTEPVNFQIESILKNPIISKLFTTEYENSVFGNIEKFLESKEFNFLNT